jgi:hypothetical protein
MSERYRRPDLAAFHYEWGCKDQRPSPLSVCNFREILFSRFSLYVETCSRHRNRRESSLITAVIDLNQPAQYCTGVPTSRGLSWMALIIIPAIEQKIGDSTLECGGLEPLW